MHHCHDLNLLWVRMFVTIMTIKLPMPQFQLWKPLSPLTSWCAHLGWGVGEGSTLRKRIYLVHFPSLPLQGHFFLSQLPSFAGSAPCESLPSTFRADQRGTMRLFECVPKAQRGLSSKHLILSPWYIPHATLQESYVSVIFKRIRR